MGFAEKTEQWSGLKYIGVDCDAIKGKNHSLSKLWKYYFEKNNKSGADDGGE